MSGLQESIESKVRTELEPSHLEVINESSMHNVPAGSQSHFRLRVVTEAFQGVSRVKRHRQIHDLLGEELRGGLHALALELMTPAEWQLKGGIGAQSPDCMGGQKRPSSP